MARFDVIIVGGGHAGAEAAAASARMGAHTALVSFDPSQIGVMSCNPAIGGLGKGHLVREVDAFDGLMGRAADASAIHYRMLNRSKGSAVQGPRIQADRQLFRQAIQQMLGALPGLHIIAGEVAALRFSGERVSGVDLADGTRLESAAVVLCTGTFLGGRLFRGEERLEGGRIGESAAHRLAAQMRNAGLPMARLKTGTPPRLDGRTIDWAQLQEQPSDADQWVMSPLTPRRINPQLSCAITRTNMRTHDLIRGGLDRSPLFGGDSAGGITGQGPRYCPSIEDKIHRFGDREGHQVFLEPEGLNSHLVYPNGISTSLPVDIQDAMVRSMEGLADCVIVTPGYAVEYDHIDPRALDRGLQLAAMPGLYCAGQINGTTGYEEAGAQGLVAGLHAACAALGKAPPMLDRANSYMAVMVDDLTLHGVTEPYRMLTARAEYRLRLRANNASTRLTPIALELGCVGDQRRAWFVSRETQREAIGKAMATRLSAGELIAAGVAVRPDAGRDDVAGWLRFPELALEQLLAITCYDGVHTDADLIAEMDEDARYAPYLDRQEAELRELRASEAMQLAPDYPYGSVPGLSNEMVERLISARPDSLAAAGRVRGITPAALAALMVHARQNTKAAA